MTPIPMPHLSPAFSIAQTFERAGISGLSDAVSSIFNVGFVKQQLWKWSRELYFNTFRRDWKTQVGGKAHDVALRCFQGEDLLKATVMGREKGLFDGCKTGDVVVLNFGSLTCPIFRNFIPDLVNLEERFSEHKFRYILVSEAHPKGWWTQVPRPKAEEGREIFEDAKTEGQRRVLAQHLVRHEGCRLKSSQIYLDTMSNEVQDRYQAWPLRLYAVRVTDEGPRIVYKGGRGPAFVDPKELKGFLEAGAPSPKEWREPLSTLQASISYALGRMVTKVWQFLRWVAPQSKQEN